MVESVESGCGLASWISSSSSGAPNSVPGLILPLSLPHLRDGVCNNYGNLGPMPGFEMEGNWGTPLEASVWIQGVPSPTF